MKLLVDIGNSRIKWCGMQQDGRLVRIHSADYEQAGMTTWCDSHLGDWPRPQAILAASVVPAAAAGWSDWCRRRWDLGPWFARSEARAGDVRNGYREPAQLGVDRWLMLIAARSITAGPVCVIGCGTAITLDLMNGAGEHLGGLIAPGPEWMRAALNMATPGARTGQPLEATLALGRTTESGVAGGVTCAAVGLIDRAVAEFHDRMAGEIQCLLSGGGAESLAPLCRVPVRVVDNLVLRGLAWYANAR